MLWTGRSILKELCAFALLLRVFQTEAVDLSFADEKIHGDEISYSLGGPPLDLRVRCGNVCCFFALCQQ